MAWRSDPSLGPANQTDRPARRTFPGDALDHHRPRPPRARERPAARRLGQSARRPRARGSPPMGRARLMARSSSPRPGAPERRRYRGLRLLSPIRAPGAELGERSRSPFPTRPLAPAPLPRRWSRPARLAAEASVLNRPALPRLPAHRTAAGVAPETASGSAAPFQTPSRRPTSLAGRRRADPSPWPRRAHGQPELPVRSLPPTDHLTRR